MTWYSPRPGVWSAVALTLANRALREPDSASEPAAFVDGGAPLTGGNGTVSGYSILQAESSEALADVLDGHPHTTHGGGATYEFLPVP
jgi:hypothetical protein